MINAVILAAGNGTRMKSPLPKVLHEIAQIPMLEHVLIELGQTNPVKSISVVANQTLAKHPKFVELKSNYKFKVVIQKQQKGTAHALMCALDDSKHDIIVTCADTPLISSKTFNLLIDEHSKGSQATCLCFDAPNPFGYGRVILDEKGDITDIVEQKSLQNDQLNLSLCNSGIMMLSGADLAQNLAKITPDSITDELYLTNIYNIIHTNGGKCGKVITTFNEVLGVNTSAQLHEADKLMQSKICDELIANGVHIMQPHTSYFARDIKAASGVKIYPNVFIGQGVSIGAGTHIHSFSWLTGCSIGADNTIGPFARIRPDTSTEEQVKIGNFVEVKKSKLGSHTKASHLSYIGDATLGSRVNIGAGTIFCNYDGVKKHHTTVEDGSFVGSNSALVAPVNIAQNTTVAAGSVITKDTTAGSIAINRAHPQKTLKKRGK